LEYPSENMRNVAVATRYAKLEEQSERARLGITRFRASFPTTRLPNLTPS
jgi:hypothetical protein